MFLSNGMADFCPADRHHAAQRFSLPNGRFSQHRLCAKSEVVLQVSDLLRPHRCFGQQCPESVGLPTQFGHGLVRVRGRPQQRQRLGLGHGRLELTFDSRQAVQGHRSAGGPFPAHQTHQTAGQCFHLVFADNLAAAPFSSAWHEKRTPAGPAAAHGGVLQIREPRPHIPEQVGLFVV